MPNAVDLINPSLDFLDSPDGVVMKQSQDIKQEYIDRNRWLYDTSMQRPMGDFHQVASVPTVVIEKWLREGFDAMQAPVKDVLKKLREEHLDYFITSKHSI